MGLLEMEADVTSNLLHVTNLQLFVYLYNLNIQGGPINNTTGQQGWNFRSYLQRNWDRNVWRSSSTQQSINSKPCKSKLIHIQIYYSEIWFQQVHNSSSEPKYEMWTTLAWFFQVKIRSTSSHNLLDDCKVEDILAVASVSPVGNEKAGDL